MIHKPIDEDSSQSRDPYERFRQNSFLFKEIYLSYPLSFYLP